MAGGGGRGGRGRGGGRKPGTSSSSSRQWKPRASREFGRESSLIESQKEGPCSSSPSVSSKKPLPQTPVQPPKSPVSLSSPKMAGGGGERKPATSSSSWQRKPWVLSEFGHERSLDSQEEESCSSSPSVISTKKSPPQMVTPVQPPESLESPPQMVTPVQPPESLESPPQTVTPVQPPESLESPPQTVTPVQPPKSLDSLVKVESLQLSKSPESKSAPSGSGAVGSDLGAAPFDICMVNTKGTVKLNRSLLDINRQRRRAKELSKSASGQHLRPGMVLLKNFLKPDDQVEIIKRCQDLGVGPGGFYQPGYREGAKLSLRMMCLGKNWDPDSSSYGDSRTFDHAQPPKMPEQLMKFVKGAIEASHEFLKLKQRSASELPLMSPDICIVNFYTCSGKLGLHQDKDETIDSLSRRLPVVSFSLGDTAEFLYGDVRDNDKASKVDLESGDVLIFGGPSRHIFHGVSKVKQNTAPTWLTDQTHLRPGRLNLTFRQY